MENIVGKRMKSRRKEIGISVEELATKTNKSRATLYRYENGDIENAPYTILEPIAKALQTTPSYLMGLTDNPHIEIQARSFMPNDDFYNSLPKTTTATFNDVIRAIPTFSKDELDKIISYAQAYKEQ